jgi:hypothetical protein
LRHLGASHDDQFAETMDIAMMKHLSFLGVFTAIHCTLTILFGTWSIAWQMSLLDSTPFGQHATAPPGLYILNGLLSVLSLPILPILLRVALYLGYADPVSNIIYWFFPPLNSLLAALIVVVVKQMVIKRRLRPVHGDNT